MEYAMLKLAYKRRQIMTKILITGIGITGKSIFREWLAKIFSDAGFDVRDYDADYDGERIFNELFESKDMVYLIEDVRGLTDKSAMPLSAFNQILYLKPSIISHIIFWIQRMIIWFESGKFDLKRETGWKGANKHYDPRNIIPILKIFLRNFKNRKKWIGEDLKAILGSGIPFRIIQSQWKSSKTIKFCATFRFKR